MAEELQRLPDGQSDADSQDDVLGKIDQLLNRHRPKAPAEDVVPLLTQAPPPEVTPVDDGIPVLTDVVGASDPSPGPSVVPLRAGSISVVLILRRMAIALEAEHARLHAQIGADPAHARILDRLVAELKRALPGAVRGAITGTAPDLAKPGDDGRL